MTLAQVTLFPEQASTVAKEVDALFWFLMLVSGFFTLLIAWLVMYFGIKYRRRSEADLPRPVHGSLKLEIAWSVIPLVIGLVIFVWSARIYVSMYRPPDNAMNIYVVARQWMWKLQHPRGQREINQLHVPLGEPVKLTMISEDVIHSFYVPAFRIKQDVLPGRYTSIWFQATKAGTYDLFCAEYCGTGHSKMRGTVVVLEPAEYQRWLDERAEGSAALEGRKLFLKLKCIACHNRESLARGPLLEGLYGQTVRFDKGDTTIVDDDYLRRSIVNPKERLVAGYQPIMPTFQGQVSEEEILDLIAFIKSLGLGDTPVRVENTEPPVAPQEP